MAKRVPEVVVRAYDLGGFGDIAGAMRVASFLQRRGLATNLRASSSSALDKMKILNPDTPFAGSEASISSGRGAIQIDVAGHYMDGRVAPNNDVPHSYTEDMDHPHDRRKVVPIYLKSGLRAIETATPGTVHLGRYTPMFYRPFREWDLPKPGERDVRQQIVQALSSKRGVVGFGRVGVEEVLGQTDKIGFAHISPRENIAEVFQHPYFQAAKVAQANSNLRFGVGVFLNKQTEQMTNAHAEQIGWNVVRSNGLSDAYDPKKPTVFFLGAQPQITTTGLFLASNIPNLVTGDLSLSDALYGLIAMEGPAFFYETASWKIPTHQELYRIFAQHHPGLADAYFSGSNHTRLPSNLSSAELEQVKARMFQAEEAVVGTFMNDFVSQRYRELMQQALRAEIRNRFGNVQVVGEERAGYYIQPGARYLLQDATARVVEALRTDPSFFAETEKTRRMIADGVPISVNVGSGVLVPGLSPEQENLEDKIFGLSIKYLSKKVILPSKKSLEENDVFYSLEQKISSEHINSFFKIKENNNNNNNNNLEEIIYPLKLKLNNPLYLEKNTEISPPHEIYPIHSYIN